MNESRKWAERVAAWELSGESAKAFAEGKGYTAGGLYYWRRRLRFESPDPIEPVRMELARVVRPSGAAESAAASPVGSADEAGIVIEARGLRVLLPRFERALFLDVVDALVATTQGSGR